MSRVHRNALGLDCDKKADRIDIRQGEFIEVQYRGPAPSARTYSMYSARMMDPPVQRHNGGAVVKPISIELRQ